MIHFKAAATKKKKETPQLTRTKIAKKQKDNPELKRNVRWVARMEQLTIFG